MPEVAYLRCVFNDPEFIGAITSLQNTYAIDGKLGWYLTANDERQFCFTKTNGKRVDLPQSFGSDVQRLSDEFGITWHHILTFNNGDGYEEIPSVIVSDIRHEESSRPTFDLLVTGIKTKQDVVDALEGFEQQVKRMYGVDIEDTKRKGLHYPKLVYAIERQRKIGKTYGQIHHEYLAGDLKNYTGPITITTLGKFSQYHRKYRPQFDDIPI